MKIFNPINLVPPQYRLAAYIVAAVLLVGVLFGGGYKTGYAFAENHYTAIISDMEAAAAKLEAEKAKLQLDLEKEIANVKERIVTKYVDRIKVIKEKEYVYRDKAENVVPSQHDLSNGWVRLHDDAARSGDTNANDSGYADGSPSGVKDNQALAVVTENYAACHANAAQLTALQEYVREVQKVVDKANEKIREYNKENK